ncbi:MAG: tRNA preQ1(34) S-adenosylmethionine ribosyltransferase-isomerase QueA [Spirochaetales bacterium]|nr:tRNA preQ1(34) S-adenosylmethionine ribosyltransferase-isomerase QueA [Spirochaetales bacterium]
METSLFSFDLPEELIATHPPKERGTCRLMSLHRQYGGPEHHQMPDLPSLVEEGTLMVFNDTRVRKARFHAQNAATGGKGEFLFISSPELGLWDCVVDKAKKKREGQEWLFPGEVKGTIVGAPASDRRLVRLEGTNGPPDESWFENHGHIPLPPYMRRDDEEADAERYQTVYAQNTGSAAAPTAGLHFTPELLAALDAKGIERAWVTLDVGLGTFAPVRSSQIEDHPMHTESFRVSEETALAVNQAKAQGRKVLAVGTTSVRTLEASWNNGALQSGSGDTNIFIYPGYDFQAVDEIFTNFHTPESSLLMLVSAFCGRERILDAYHQAVQERYRFFSYGDAMYLRK